jgi:predicted transposase/invertase (TIGR01784 family)
LDKALQAARDDAWEDALEEGETKGKVDAAQVMLSDGVPLEKVVQYTGLSRADLEKLK